MDFLNMLSLASDTSLRFAIGSGYTAAGDTRCLFPLTTSSKSVKLYALLRTAFIVIE